MINTILRTPQLTFENVLWNGEDQVLVKKILLEVVPQEIKTLVIKRFNQAVIEKNKEFLEEQENILQERMNWTSIKEAMPKEGVPVLVSNGKEVWSASYVVIDKKAFWSCHGFGGYDIELEFDNPTHWMDLPEPPNC